MQVTKTGNTYSLRAKDNKISDKEIGNDFVRAMHSRTEGSKRTEITDEELKELKSKYNPSDMSYKDNISLLGDLVELGILTKMEATNIYTGFVPLDKNNLESARKDGMINGNFSSCNINDRHSYGVGLGSAISGNVIDNFDEMYKHIFENTDVNLETSKTINSYREFMSILAKLAVERQTV